MLLAYSQYFKQYCNRKLSHLLSPLVFHITQFKFPRDSVYHHSGFDDNQPVPDEKSAIFSSIGKRIPIEHVTSLATDSIYAKRNAVMAQNLYRDFHRVHKQFRLVKNLLLENKDNSNIGVVNYGYIEGLYRYVKMPLTPVHKWYEIESTVWSNINTMASSSDSQHFVFINVPKLLPSRTILNMFSNKTSIAMLKLFTKDMLTDSTQDELDYDKLFILELWKWMSGDNRENSVLSKLDPKYYSKVNLVFWHKDRWFTMKMSFLDNVRKVDGKKPEAGMILLDPAVLQKVFLKLCMTLQSQSSPQESAVEITKDVPDVSETPEDTEKEFEDETDDESTEISSQPVITPTETESEVPVNVDVDSADSEFDLTTVLKDIDEDLEVLDRVNKQDQIRKGLTESDELPKESKEINDYSDEDSVVLTNLIHTDESPQAVLAKQIDTLAEYGVMPASEYRSIMKQANQYMEKENPYDGGKPIKEFIHVSKEETLLNKDKTTFRDIENVIDKSMLQSTVAEFTSKYVKEIMPKNITAMVANIQKAGIVIQDHVVEKETSILGDYEYHTLKIKPIDGVASTLRFKIPAVNEAGEFLSNGNKYLMRKQRCDVPLRKINDFRVGITSYYGKVFVQRCAYKAYDSVSWLTNQISFMANDENNTIISECGPANVFDNYFRSPKIYSGLSKYFKSITVNAVNYTFDHKERLKLADEITLKAVEQDKYITVGKDKQGNFIVVGYDDVFYRYKDNIYTPVGNIYQQLLINEADAPLDFAELQVFAKALPLGIVLGYYLGLDNLVKVLKLKPKVVGAKERVVLTNDEYALVFRDKKLIFSRKDKYASLIMGGFVNYKKTIKNYHLENFNNSAVYLNVLESQGITARYIRELELLKQLFVDPITKQILEEMNEPVTFIGLLLRGCEMLLLDEHPDSQDMRFMRIRGYERFAGAVYKEMVISIREYQARNIRGKSKVEMSPYAVSMNICGDTSIKLVEDINPIQNLKEMEAVTYSGEGGRNKDAIIKSTRAYHVTDMGVISEATVDSADVGVNTYLSANPNLTSVYGLTNRYDQKQGLTSLYSSAAMASPFANRDDQF